MKFSAFIQKILNFDLCKPIEPNSEIIFILFNGETQRKCVLIEGICLQQNNVVNTIPAAFLFLHVFMRWTIRRVTWSNKKYYVG